MCLNGRRSEVLRRTLPAVAAALLGPAAPAALATPLGLAASAGSVVVCSIAADSSLFGLSSGSTSPRSWPGEREGEKV